MPPKQMRFDTSDSDADFYTVEEADFPTTRYQGSKRRILDWVWQKMDIVEFDSLLDAFGGTGTVAFRAKQHGKRVVYNDYMTYNHYIGKAIIENDNVTLDEDDIGFLLERHNEYEYPTFIQDTFEGIYFTDDENAWLDTVRRNVREFDCEYKTALAFAVIGQCCLAKRPYNLFHRANLDMRLNDVDRSFGNKATWDKPFGEHFSEKVAEFNDAVFNNGYENGAYGRNALEWTDPPETDLVYIDPPYFDRTTNNNSIDYRFYYHFLEGFIKYEKWNEMIDHTSKTKKVQSGSTPWMDEAKVYDAFDRLFDIYSDRIIVVSYNSAGLPTPQELKTRLSKTKENVEMFAKDYQYVLSPEEKQEVLIVAYD